jgi:hypothetical protein
MTGLMPILDSFFFSFVFQWFFMLLPVRPSSRAMIADHLHAQIALLNIHCQKWKKKWHREIIRCLPVADDGVELDGLLLCVGELAMLEVKQQIVGPP